MADTVQKIRLTQMKSVIGRLQSHKDCVTGLGLRRIRHSVVIDATPSNMGMVNKVSYLLKIEEV